MGRRLLAALALCGVAAERPLAQESKSALVHMLDGTSFPVQNWSLSYEYQAWRAGTPQFQAQPTSTSTSELWVGKKAFPVKGHTLEIVYQSVRREREVEGKPQVVSVNTGRGLTLVAPDGRRTSFKLEAPHRDMLLPGAGKTLLVAPRTLDLHGETFTGTKRALCLLSFTSLVECPDDPAQQVAKIEFGGE
jgi:hypothetical protein